MQGFPSDGLVVPKTIEIKVGAREIQFKVVRFMNREESERKDYKKQKVRDKNFTAQEIISLAEHVRQYRKKLYGQAGHCSDRVSCLV